MPVKKDHAQSSKGERTRSKVVNAAHRLFLSKGYNGASMRAIAGEAGLALGGIYNHFANKEEIFVALLMERHPFLELMPALNEAQGETVEELVRDAARQMLAGLGRRPDVLNLMFIELVEFEGRHVSQLYEIMYPQIMDFGKRLAAKQGTLRHIPVPILSRAFTGLFFSYYMTERLIGEYLPAKLRRGAFDHFVEIYLHGILTN